ncbi:hypothetical protein TNCV_2975441 [Trichonephila clavipes]|nr:hypothetical protein TNCV_2975441 [Trichonephila clavipes]
MRSIFISPRVALLGVTQKTRLGVKLEKNSRVGNILPHTFSIHVASFTFSDHCSWAPLIKSFLKGTYLTSVEEVQTKTENLPNCLPKTSFQNCYQQWQHRMQKWGNAEENYFEGDNVTESSDFEDIQVNPDPFLEQYFDLRREIHVE